MRRIREELEKICLEPVHASPPDVFLADIRNLDKRVLLESAGTFGTPQYLLDLDRLKERAAFFIRTMRLHLPNSEFFYAFKCNDLPLLIQSVKEAGFQADVAGLFEMKLALRLGFERILFSGPGKSEEELSCAIKNRDRVIINVDNRDELFTLKELAGEKRTKRKVRIGFRLNSELSSPPGKTWSKFGFELDELPNAVRLADESPNLKWAGLHFHTSWNKNPHKYVENIKRAGGFLGSRFSRDRLRNLQFFDMGGGFYPENQTTLHKGEDKGIVLDILGKRCGNREEVFDACRFDPLAFGMTAVDPLEKFAVEIADGLRQYIMPLNPEMAVYFEPGRFIAAHSTLILLKVAAVKKNCVIVDGGINMLGDYKFSEYAFAPVVNLTRPSERFRRRVIYGSLCDPDDLWGYSFYGDEPQKGDVLAVLQQGAYTFSTAWRFIKPVPPYVAFSGGGFILAKAKERFQERYAGCRFYT